MGFKNVKTCPCIIDTSISFPVLPKTYIPSVIFVGRIAPHKNCIELLRLVYNTATHFKRKIKLIIVGQTKKDSFYGMAFRRALSKYASQYLEIEWIQRNVSLEELLSLYARSWLYVSASLHEGFGLPACEAIYCKTPALYLECGGQESVLRSWGKIGLEGINQFSYTLEELIENARERSILLTKQEEQTAQFDLKKVAPIAQSVYGSLFDGQRAHQIMCSTKLKSRI
jgi:glycosyltransferase involved in cell wall biosynthesis